MNEAKVSPHYVLVMDEKRNLILSCLISASTSVLGRPVLDFLCSTYKITTEELVDFMREVSEKEHALGWCKDPSCKSHKPKP